VVSIPVRIADVEAGTASDRLDVFAITIVVAFELRQHQVVSFKGPLNSLANRVVRRFS